MKTTGVVTSLTRYAAKGVPGETLNQAVLREGSGMEGDFHADGAGGMGGGAGDRQLSLLSAEAREWMNAQPAPGLCFSRFKENIGIGGIPPTALRSGTRLRAGEVLLEITGETKRCHEACPLFSAGTPCRLTGQSLFARVIRGGMLRAGDEIEILGISQEKLAELADVSISIGFYPNNANSANS
jgi:MOSC domain-containing protein YiiM